MGKIISVFGKNGSGKSTLAVNLACALAEEDKVVILFSANLDYGSIQIFFGETILPEYGVLNALNDTSEQPQNKLTPIKKFKNIFLLGVPNAQQECYIEDMEQKKVENLFQRLKICSDFIIVDSTSNLRDPITLMGLHLADQVVCTFTPSVETYLWYKSTWNFFHLFGRDQVLLVLGNFHLGCALPDFRKQTELDFSFVLPEVEEAYIRQNTGQPIFRGSSKSCKAYKTAIQLIAHNILEENHA